jgi:two-component system sensor histidine kinase ChvG
LPPSPPLIAVPAGTIETVIGGLIDNSRRAGASRCTIAATLMAGSIRLDVTDDGAGIAPGDRKRLFEPFFTTRRADGGTGLGLPIARSLLDACNGSIRLDGNHDGAHFALDLPLA